MKNKIFHGTKPLFFYLLYFSDVAMFFVSVIISSLLFNIDLDLNLNLNISFYPRFFLFTLLILLINYSAYNLYKDKRTLFDDNDFMRIMYSVIITFFVLIIFDLLFFPNDGFILFLVATVLFLTWLFTTIARFLLYTIMYQFRKAGYDRKKVLFFGNENPDLITKVKENKSLGYELLISTDNLSILKKYLKKVDIVFLTKENIDEKLLKVIIENDHINWKIVSSVLNLVIDPVSFDEFKDYPMINVSSSKKNLKYYMIKRIFDVLISGIALVFLIIPFLIEVIIVKFTMPGPIFFMQERLGKNLKPFQIYKLRTMIVNADKMKNKLKDANEVKGLFKMKNDPRVTKLGKFLRRTCLDELPQLINVFKGDMSIVGPRPHLEIELDNFSGWRKVRFKVKPGLTGMWQVNGRHEVNFDKAVLYDIYYIKHMSLILDLTIILKTIPSIIMSRGRY
jgi:exopolysaccharide biosynthesis polyprenyl glycosylphosphotransferase